MWQLARKFVINVYKLTEKFPSSEKYGIIDQLKRAAVSVPTNLAEGSGRNTDKDKAYFTQLAFSSLMECLNLLILSSDLGYILKEELASIRNDIELISKKLSNYRRAQLSNTTKPLNS